MVANRHKVRLGPRGVGVPYRGVRGATVRHSFQNLREINIWESGMVQTGPGDGPSEFSPKPLISMAGPSGLGGPCTFFSANCTAHFLTGVDHMQKSTEALT